MEPKDQVRIVTTKNTRLFANSYREEVGKRVRMRGSRERGTAVELCPVLWDLRERGQDGQLQREVRQEHTDWPPVG